MFNKRGQQASVGMSFGMIFSIFLIIVFVAIAIIVIKVFLNFSNSADIGGFYTNLQDEINDAWRSSQTSKTFKLNLDKDIEYVCFVNLSAPIEGEQKKYFDVIQDYNANVFLVPPKAARDMGYKKMEHLDISKITSVSNPYCVKNPGKLTIIKGLRSRLVVVR